MIVELTDEERRALEYLAARRGETTRKALSRLIKHGERSAYAADRGFVNAGLITREAQVRFRKGFYPW